MWMIDEAEEAGLKFERRNRDIKVHTDYAEVTESLKGGWWLFEILPITRESYRLGNDRYFFYSFLNINIHI